MQTTPHGWKVLDRDAGILSYEYPFAPDATANAFTARLHDGSLLVISPPSRVSESTFADLEAFGGVGAVLANNGFHHLGLPEWKDRFPEARFFADPLARKRIEKKNAKAPPLEPVEALMPLLADGVEVTAVPQTRCGESWAWARGEGGHYWFTSDVLSNLPSLPANFFLRTMFQLTGTRAGFGVFHTAMKFIVKDKKATLRRLQAELQQHAPVMIVPGHGTILGEEDLAERAQAVIATAL